MEVFQPFFQHGVVDRFFVKRSLPVPVDCFRDFFGEISDYTSFFVPNHVKAVLGPREVLLEFLGDLALYLLFLMRFGFEGTTSLSGSEGLWGVWRVGVVRGFLGLGAPRFWRLPKLA